MGSNPQYSVDRARGEPAASAAFIGAIGEQAAPLQFFQDAHGPAVIAGRSRGEQGEKRTVLSARAWLPSGADRSVRRESALGGVLEATPRTAAEASSRTRTHQRRSVRVLTTGTWRSSVASSTGSTSCRSWFGVTQAGGGRMTSKAMTACELLARRSDKPLKSCNATSPVRRPPRIHDREEVVRGGEEALADFLERGGLAHRRHRLAHEVADRSAAWRRRAARFPRRRGGLSGWSGSV